jgi:hypothetical protein
VARAPDKRDHARVNFSRGVAVNILAIDGTWRRAAQMLDVSEDGAKLEIEDNIAGLNLKEFFLVLSSVGTAFRRCELAWVQGSEVGVRFIRKSENDKRRSSTKKQ